MSKPQCTPFDFGRFCQAFWDKVEISEGCWLWIGAKNSDGYGQISFEGKTEKAHRISWVLHFGTIPDGLQVLHNCDNPPCVRPDHLFLGTQGDNVRDCSEKGRIKTGDRRGEKNARSKFTASQVEFIRTVAAEGFTRSCIAKYFGVCRQSIDDIVNRENWAHVP